MADKKNLNQAKLRELRNVPQIGAILAKRIQAGMPYTSWSEVEALFELGPIRVANLQRYFEINDEAQRHSKDTAVAEDSAVCEDKSVAQDKAVDGDKTSAEEDPAGEAQRQGETQQLKLDVEKVKHGAVSD